MHADPTDRIFQAETADAGAPRISVPRIFVVGLVLPFAHPLRLAMASLVPAALIAWMAHGPLGHAIDTWTAILSASSTGTTPQVPPSFGADVVATEGILIAAATVWLCAWQRAAARNFAEPMLQWLIGALLRLPGYVLAVLVWVLPPTFIIMLAFGGAAWAVKRGLGDGPIPIAPDEALIWFAHALTPLQWWVLGAAMLTMVALALWLSARLLPLPALAASQGLRRSFGEAWRLSSGHAFGLAVSLLGYALFGTFAIGIVGAAIGIAYYARGDAALMSSGLFATLGAAIDLAIAGLIVLWQGSLGALIVREGSARVIDPAMFD